MHWGAALYLLVHCWSTIKAEIFSNLYNTCFWCHTVLFSVSSADSDVVHASPRFLPSVLASSPRGEKVTHQPAAAHFLCCPPHHTQTNPQPQSRGVIRGLHASSAKRPHRETSQPILVPPAGPPSDTRSPCLSALLTLASCPDLGSRTGTALAFLGGQTLRHESFCADFLSCCCLSIALYLLSPPTPTALPENVRRFHCPFSVVRRVFTLPSSTRTNARLPNLAGG